MDLIPFRNLGTFSRWPTIWDDFDSTWSNTRGSLDVFETEDEVVVKANVAGVESDDVDLTFEDGVLWIKASKQEEQQDEKKTHYAKSSWSYSYKIAIPGNIDLNKDPTAELKSGVLTVTFPKLEAAKPKKLQIKSSGK